MHLGVKSSKIELKARQSVKSLWIVWFSLDVVKILNTFDEKDWIWENVTITMKNNKFNFLGVINRSSTSGNSLICPKWIGFICLLVLFFYFFLVGLKM